MIRKQTNYTYHTAVYVKKKMPKLFFTEFLNLPESNLP